MSEQRLRLINWRAVVCAIISGGIAVSPVLADTGYSWQDFVSQGDQQLKLQRLPQAEECYRQALKVARAQKQIDDIAACELKLAAILASEDIDEEAIALYKKTIKQLERAHGKNSASLIAPLLALGKVQELDGEYQKAIKLYVRAVALARAYNKTDAARLAFALHNLGQASAKAGLAHQAEDSYREALALTMSQSGTVDSFELIALLSDYIDLEQHYGGPSKTLVSQFQNELLKDQVQKLASTRAVAPSSFQNQVSLSLKPDKQSAPLVLSENTQALGQKSNSDPGASGNQPAEGDPSSAELIREIARQNATHITPYGDDLSTNGVDYLERMIAIDVKTLGPNHPSVARDLKGLAAVYVNQGNFDQARPLLVRALNIYQSIYSPDSTPVKRLTVLLDLLDKAQASAAVTPVLLSEIFGKTIVPLNAQTLEVAQRLNQLAFDCYCQGKLEDSGNIYAYALDSTARATGERSTCTAACLKDYERVLRSLGQTAQAEKYSAMSRNIQLEATAVKLLRVE